MKKQSCPDLDAFLPDMRASSKWEAISELVASLGAAGLVSNPGIAIEDIETRERSLSTGLTSGIALPHARSSAVTRRCCAVGISRGGIEFDCLDGMPAHIVFMVLSTHSTSGPHLECLAEISIALSDQDRRRRMIEAVDLQTARNALR